MLLMIKPRPRETGEGVHYSHYVEIGDWFVYHNERVNRVMVHLLARFHYLGVLANRLRVLGHDSANRSCKEILSESLHGPTNITVGDDAD